MNRINLQQIFSGAFSFMTGTLLFVLSFSSCAKMMDYDIETDEGMLYLSGEVYDAETMSPIEGISLILSAYDMAAREDSAPVFEEEFDIEEDGSFSIEMEIPSFRVYYILKAVDSDGEENGLYEPYECKLNVSYTSPGYNHTTNTFTMEKPIPMVREK